MKYTILLSVLIILCGSCWNPPSPGPLPPFDYGAGVNPTGDEIGGGDCYSAHITEGDYQVSTKIALLNALQNAQPGEVVFVQADINLSGEHTIPVQTGVTLAGSRGNCNDSPGPLLFCDEMPSGKGLLSVRPGARVTGIRFRGPDADIENINYDTDSASWNKCMLVWGDNSEVDNCEISNFHHAGISTNNGGNNVHIHHNYFHDIHAYPVLVVNNTSANVLVEANRIEWIHEAIAAIGNPGSGYEARYNIFARVAAPAYFQPYAGGHSIDMHPNRVIKKSRNHLIGGDYVHIHYNTFISEAGTDPSVSGAKDAYIKGVPRVLAEFHNNCFLNADPTQAVVHVGGNTWVHNNLYGPDSNLVMMPMETTPQIIFNSPPPPDIMIPVFSSPLPVSIEVNVKNPVQLDSISITLDGNVIYEGIAAPGPGELDIDVCSLQYTPTWHELVVYALDNRGVSATHLTPFRAGCD